MVVLPLMRRPVLLDCWLLLLLCYGCRHCRSCRTADEDLEFNHSAPLPLVREERFTKNSNYLPIDYFEPSKLLEACAAKEGTKAGLPSSERVASCHVLSVTRMPGVPRPDTDRRGAGRLPQEGFCSWPVCQALKKLAASFLFSAAVAASTVALGRKKLCCLELASVFVTKWFRNLKQVRRR